MASNTILDPGAGGATLVTRQVSHDGDTAMLPGSFIFGITGTEDAYTIGAINGDATNGLDVDVTRLPALVAGTANIGDVGVTSLPAIPAGTNLIGSVSAGLSTSAIYNGTTALTPAYISIDTATSGNNTLVTPAAGKEIRVLAFNLIAVGTAVNVHILAAAVAKFGSATRPIVLDKAGTTGPAGFNSGFCPTGWFEGAADAALILNLSAAQGVVGNVVYVEV